MLGKNDTGSPFPLTGLADNDLAKKVIKSVTEQSYSNDVLADIREPLRCDLKSYASDITIDNILNKQQDMLKKTVLNKTVSIQQSSGMKAVVKRYLSKLIGWYISSIADRQMQINYNAIVSIFELAKYTKTLEERIEHLEQIGKSKQG